MLKSLLRNPGPILRSTLAGLLAVTIAVSLVVPPDPVDCWQPARSPQEITTADLSVTSPCSPERERPVGEKFLKSTAVGLPMEVLIRSESFRDPEIAGGGDAFRLAALLVYTQTTSSRL